ncbi:MAG: DUF3025 domain-containing protein [Polyangiales bacterium]
MVGAFDMGSNDRRDGGPGDVSAASHEHVTDVRDRIAAQPAFAASRATAESLLEAGWPSLERLSEVAGIRCVADVSAPRRRGRLRERASLYDASITERGVLPTRAANWHDLFNVVIWAAFPRTKRALHARQYRRLCERVPAHFQRLPGARTPEQSALTQLDEGGLLLCVPDHAPIGAEERLLTTLAHLATARIPLTTTHLAPHEARPLIFGHALLEHLALEAPAPRAAVVLLRCPPLAVDLTLAQRLDDDRQPFTCAPVSAWITSALSTRETAATVERGTQV